MHLNNYTYVHKIFIFKILPLSKNYEVTNSWNYHGIVHFWTCGTTRNGSSGCPTLHLTKEWNRSFRSSFFFIHGMSL